MIRTFYIDDSDSQAQALIDYLLTLDFVDVDMNDECTLTENQIQVLKERRESYLSGKSKTRSWEDIKKELGEKRKR